MYGSLIKRPPFMFLINRSYALIVSDFPNVVFSWTKFSSISSGSDSPHWLSLDSRDSISLSIGASFLSWDFNFSTYSHSLYDNGVVRLGVYLLSISDFRYVFLLWIYEHYQASKDPERYFRKYESRLILFCGAEHILHENGIDIHALKTSQLKKKYATLLKQKTELLAQYNHSQNEQKHLIYLQNNMNRYLSRETSINSEIAHSLKPEKGR